MFYNPLSRFVSQQTLEFVNFFAIWALIYIACDYVYISMLMGYKYDHSATIFCVVVGCFVSFGVFMDSVCKRINDDRNFAFDCFAFSVVYFAVYLLEKYVYVCLTFDDYLSQRITHDNKYFAVSAGIFAFLYVEDALLHRPILEAEPPVEYEPEFADQ